MKFILTFSFYVFLIACHSVKTIPIPKERHRYAPYSAFVVDPKIRDDAAFREMDALPEIPSVPGESIDSSAKRTSFVRLSRRNPVKIREYDNLLAPCIPMLLEDHLVDIRIALSSYEMDKYAKGLDIEIRNSEFRIIPYCSDGGILSKGHISHRAEYQNLILDKPAYSTSDSVYGFVSFSIVETQPGGDKIFYKGAGQFRGKVR